MSFEEKFIAAENRLSEEGNSFAVPLQQIRSRISRALIGDRGWEKVLAFASGIPASVAAFPFGFELRLHERETQADLGVSLIGGTQSVEFFQRRGTSRDATSQEAGLAWLLQDAESDQSEIQQIVGRKLMLEFDFISAADDVRPAPGIFLRPSEQPIVGGNQQSQACSIVLDALVRAVGWESCSEEHRNVQRVYQAQGNTTRIDSFGAFPSRKRCIRTGIVGFRNVPDILTFLRRANWSGCRDAIVASTVEHFENHDAFACMGVHLDVNAGGLGSTLGLSFMPKDRVAQDPRYWLDHPTLWNAFLNCLREGNLVVPDKLSALTNWQSGPEVLIGKSGALVFIRGIHHIKIVIREDRIDEVKAYIFCLLCPWLQEGNADS